eukprot:6491349-Amphidinium_carterae.1
MKMYAANITIAGADFHRKCGTHADCLKAIEGGAFAFEALLQKVAHDSLARSPSTPLEMIQSST